MTRRHPSGPETPSLGEIFHSAKQPDPQAAEYVAAAQRRLDWEKKRLPLEAAVIFLLAFSILSSLLLSLYFLEQIVGTP